MSAHTLVTGVQVGETLSGVKVIAGTFTGTASYDTGGSIFDLSTKFGDEVRSIIALAQGTTGKVCHFVPGASNGAALGKLVVDDGGTQASSTDDLSGITFDYIAIGTDA